MNQDFFKHIEQNNLSFQLSPVSIKELVFCETLPCDLYSIIDGLFSVVLNKGAPMGKEPLRDLIRSGHVKLFIKRSDQKFFIKHQGDNLRNATRSLSVGDALDNGKKQMSLITTNLEYLYKDPTDDDLLQLVHQSAKNLVYFLLKNPNIHRQLYEDFLLLQFKPLYTQPLLSSLFLTGMLQQMQIFSEKEIESLFLTNYFKDIGMGMLPDEIIESNNLTDVEKLKVAGHPNVSQLILSGRLPLGDSHMKIIRYHHELNPLSEFYDPRAEEKIKLLSGTESMIVCIMDLVSERLTSKNKTDPSVIYNSLELVKQVFGEKHPAEFKLVVAYFKKFFMDE